MKKLLLFVLCFGLALPVFAQTREWRIGDRFHLRSMAAAGDRSISTFFITDFYNHAWGRILTLNATHVIDHLFEISVPPGAAIRWPRIVSAELHHANAFHNEIVQFIYRHRQTGNLNHEWNQYASTIATFITGEMRRNFPDEPNGGLAPPPPPPCLCPPPCPCRPSQPLCPQHTYDIQVGAFRVRNNADGVVQTLRGMGLYPVIRPAGGLFRVIVPKVPAAKMDSTFQKLRRACFSDAFAVRNKN